MHLQGRLDLETDFLNVIQFKLLRHIVKQPIKMQHTK